MEWYAKMGHLNFKDLLESINKGNMRSLNITEISEEVNCEM